MVRENKHNFNERTNERTNERYNSVDLCKLIMAVCVVAIHTQPLVKCDSMTIVKVYEAIVNIANPFFFLSAGFLISRKAGAIDNSIKTEKVLKEYVKKIVSMYLLWTLIYLPPAIMHYSQSGNTILWNVLDYIRGLLFLGEHYNSHNLWFLLATIYGVSAIMLLLKKGIKFNKVMGISVCLMVWGFVFTELVAVKDSLPLIVQLPVKAMWVVLGPRGRLFSGIGYISLGMLYGLDRKNFCRFRYPLFIVGMLGSIMTEGVAESIFIAFSACGLLGIVLEIRLKDLKNYYVLRKMSTGIYFVHLYVWMSYYMLIYGTKTYGFDSFLCTVFLSALISYLYAELKRRSRAKQLVL